MGVNVGTLHPVPVVAMRGKMQRASVASGLTAQGYPSLRAPPFVRKLDDDPVQDDARRMSTLLHFLLRS